MLREFDVFCNVVTSLYYDNGHALTLNNRLSFLLLTTIYVILGIRFSSKLALVNRKSDIRTKIGVTTFHLHFMSKILRNEAYTGAGTSLMAHC
jgi:hypothetical protein